MGIFDRLSGRRREKEKKQETLHRDWRFYANRANTYAMEGKLTEAIADYTQAIKSLPPANVSVFMDLSYLRGAAYYHRGRSTNNEDDCKHAIEDLRLMARGRFFWKIESPIDEYAYIDRYAKAMLMCGDASVEIRDYDAAVNYYTELVQRWTPEIAASIGSVEAVERKLGIAKRKRKIALALPNIGKLKGRRDVEALTKALDHKVEEVRRQAAEALGEIKDNRAVGPLIEALRDEKDSVRQRAADALGRIGDREACEPLIITLREDSNEFVRGYAAEALGRVKDQRTAEALAKALLEDESSHARSAAAKSLGNIGDKESVKLLVEALEDQNSYVRTHAVIALGKIGGGREVDLLQRISKDESEDSRVRGAAEVAIGRIRKKLGS